jgi:hypothetical protein
LLKPWNVLVYPNASRMVRQSFSLPRPLASVFLHGF